MEYLFGSINVVTAAVIVFAAVIFLYRNKIKNSGKQKSAITSIAEKYNCVIDCSTSWNNRCIAFDKKNKQLLFSDSNLSQVQELCIPLSQVISVHVTEQRSLINNYLKRIWIEIRTTEGSTHLLHFYDEAYDGLSTIPWSCRLVYRWKRRIEYSTEKLQKKMQPAIAIA